MNFAKKNRCLKSLCELTARISVSETIGCKYSKNQTSARKEIKIIALKSFRNCSSKLINFETCFF